MSSQRMSAAEWVKQEEARRRGQSVPSQPMQQPMQQMYQPMQQMSQSTLLVDPLVDHDRWVQLAAEFEFRERMRKEKLQKERESVEWKEYEKELASRPGYLRN